MVRHLSLLLILLSGCAVSIGGTQSGHTVGNDESFSGFKSVGLGESELEAERDAWHDAAARLHAKGYTSFELNQTGKSISKSSSGEKSRVEMTAHWNVADAVRGKNGPCRCGNKHSDQHAEH